jgi:hypothetical protein
MFSHFRYLEKVCSEEINLSETSIEDKHTNVRVVSNVTKECFEKKLGYYFLPFLDSNLSSGYQITCDLILTLRLYLFTISTFPLSFSKYVTHPIYCHDLLA